MYFCKKDNMPVIELDEMEFYAHHGCFDEERAIGTKFTVSIILEAEISKAVISDKLTDTLDYQQAVDIVSKEMKITSNLIENVAGRIADSMLKSFSNLQKVTVKVSKMNPPLSCKMNKVSVQITKNRQVK
jgi:7,8-dihydroneopterin aldolase/epimerase/oxygenase